MDSFKNLKGIKALVDAREYLRIKIVIVEVLEQAKSLKKNVIEEEKAFIKEILEKIRSINNK